MTARDDVEPLGRPQGQPLTHVVHQAFLDNDACDALLARAPAADDAWADGTVYDGDLSTAPALRTCRTAPLVDDGVLGWLQETVAAINANAFGFDLKGGHEDDAVAFMRYDVGGRFAWHVDVGPSPPLSSRKLAFSLQLTPPAAYVGGDLEFAHLALTAPDAHRALQQAIRRRGVLTVFASNLLHRVTPVTQGQRTVVVGWVHGPRFR